MKQLDAKFVTSAAGKDSWPESALPEVVVVGRSNVGKSSFINALTNRKRLAYVGSTPGKTQLLNFFEIDGNWMLVDVPGYGYAKLSKNQIQKLGTMMDEYLGQRENIACIVSLIDARHEPSADDIDMIQYLKDTGRKVIVGATKIDKVPKTKRLAAMKKISQVLQLPMKSIFPVSAVEKSGLEEIHEAVLNTLPKAEVQQ
jgi:GTP-binding protein